MVMAEPYEKIRNLSALRTDFLEKYNALLEQKAAPVRVYVEGCYNRIFQQLNTVRCKDHFWSAVTTERDGALHKVDTAKDLNEFVLLRFNANQAKIDWINTLDKYEHAPARGTGSGCSSGWRLCACKGCHSRSGAPPCDGEHSGRDPGLVADQQLCRAGCLY